ncbi:MAG: ATP-binding cassette domain-containing protein [Thermosynechococcus sp.]|uniref:ATP-binding cassette domain-containing protein n=1 Tax=Thermosynechococcus sp. TaxID=2814275 RepID=UPI00391C49DD
MTALLEIRDLHFGYGATPSLLQGIDLTVKAGDRLGIIGDNGSGKTTLLLLCAAVLKPQRGTITCLGQSVVAGQFQPAVGVVLQQPADQLIGATVRVRISPSTGVVIYAASSHLAVVLSLLLEFVLDDLARTGAKLNADSRRLADNQ